VVEGAATPQLSELRIPLVLDEPANLIAREYKKMIAIQTALRRAGEPVD